MKAISLISKSYLLIIKCLDTTMEPNGLPYYNGTEEFHLHAKIYPERDRIVVGSVAINRIHLCYMQRKSDLLRFVLSWIFNFTLQKTPDT